ncbi:MAG: hypothetical protein GY869_28205 [Planctomycetes bacterium]|nr:hypothetical protein [Planctomycetota bacterium]
MSDEQRPSQEKPPNQTIKVGGIPSQAEMGQVGGPVDPGDVETFNDLSSEHGSRMA